MNKSFTEVMDANDPIVEWLQFLDAKSEEVMEVLAEKNESIGKAYEVLRRISQDDVARMAYEAREAEIRDQLTREKSAKEQGIQQGIQQGVYQVATALLDILDNEMIALKTGLSIAEVQKLRGN